MSSRIHLSHLNDQRRQPAGKRRPWVVFLRLAGFGLAMLLLFFVGLFVIQDYREMRAELAPAQRKVDLPAGITLPLETVTFNALDGIHLAGWYVPPTNGATIILLHGYGGTRADMLFHAEALVKAGYGVLLYDERASGESGGDHRSFGWQDGPDVGGAIAFIKSRAGATQAVIGLAGCSIGAQIGLQGAADYPEIAAVWADGPANIRAADNPPVKNVLSGLVQASNVVLDWMYEIQLGVSAPPPLIDRISQIAPRPVMLVGGGKDLNFYGSEAVRVERFASFAGPNAQVWVIADAIHCDGPAQQPQEYARRLVQFFDASFAGKK